MLGREFGYELIEQVAQRPAAELRLRARPARRSRAPVLPRRRAAILLPLQARAGAGRRLRHACCAARRQELHARVAAALERHFADLVERHPELLAHHLTAAGETETRGRSVAQGRPSMPRRARLIREAIRAFRPRPRRCRSVAGRAGATRGKLELQLARGLSLFTDRGFVRQRAAQVYARARELAES